MIKNLKFKVPSSTTKDLNDVSKLNATASVKSKYQIPPIKNGSLIKGANGVINIYKQEYSNDQNQKGLAENTFRVFNSAQSTRSRGSLTNQDTNKKQLDFQFSWARNNWITFWYQYNMFIQQTIELLKYKNLPKGLDKYKLETILNNNGLVGIINVDDLFIAVTVFNSLEENKNKEKEARDHYRYFSGARPNFVKIIGDYPTILKPIIKAKNNKFLVDKDIFVIRNDLYCHSSLILIGRYLQDWLIILNQFEQNITKALPKALFVSDSNANLNESILKQTLNNFANNTDSFQPIILDQSLLDKMVSMGLKTPYIPIQFQDATIMLKGLNDYFVNKIKEILGHKTLQVSDKQQRLLTGEIESASTLSDFNLEHKVNLRNIDLEVFNEAFNLKVKVEKNKVDPEEGLTATNKETKKLKIKGGN